MNDKSDLTASDQAATSYLFIVPMDRANTERSRLDNWVVGHKIKRDMSIAWWAHR